VKVTREALKTSRRPTCRGQRTGACRAPAGERPDRSIGRTNGLAAVRAERSGRPGSPGPAVPTSPRRPPVWRARPATRSGLHRPLASREAGPAGPRSQGTAGGRSGAPGKARVSGALSPSVREALRSSGLTYSAITTILRNRTEILSAQAQIHAAQANLKLAKSNYLSTFSATAS
jgi:hypothetical protein